MEQQKKVYTRIFESLQKTFQKKESTYKEIRDLLAPGTGAFSCTDDAENDNINYKKMLDSEPSSYLDSTCAGLYGGLINPASRWFDLTVDKSDPKFQEYDFYDIYNFVEQTREFFYFLFSKTNFYDAMRGVINEWERYGVGVMLVEERDYDFVLFNPLTIGEYYLGIDDAGRYTKLARQFTLTSDRMVQEFGEENCPENVIRAYKKGDYDTKFKVNHLICENNKNGIVSKRFKFVDLYWMDGDREKPFLRQSGFYSNPIAVFAWERKNLRTIYPIGLGEKMLGDTKELQYTVKCINVNKSYLSNPALALHTSLGKKPILPGSRFYTDQDPAKIASEIFRVNPYIAELEDSRTRLLDKLRRMSYADILMLFAQREKGNMTAREVAALTSEQMAMLAPVYLQAKSGLESIFERLFDICKRRGWFPKDSSVNPNDLKVEFLSSIAKTQRLAELGSMQDLIMYVGQIAQMKPGALDYINEDAIIMDIAERLGNASKINSTERVAELRQAQAEQQQAINQMQMQAEQMKIAKDAAKAEIKPNNLLGQQIISQGGAIPTSAEQMQQQGGMNGY